MSAIPLFDEFLEKNKSDIADLSKFRLWHVESLLSQASNIFDRCLSGMQYHDSLFLEHAKLSDQLEYEIKVNAIEKERINNNSIKKDKIASKLEKERLNLVTTQYLSAMDHAQKLYDHHDKHGGTNHWNAGKELNRTIISKHHHETRLKEIDFEDEFLSEDVVLREKIYEEKWNSINIIQNQIEFIQAKLKENRRLFARDMADARDRCIVAAEGLQLIYGYNIPCPSENNNDENTLINWIVWCRNAVMWLAAFSQLDQGMIKTLSIKNLVDDISWSEFINSSKNSSKLYFKIPKEYFEPYSYVRIRGVRAFTSEINSKDSIWALDVKLPQFGVMAQADGNLKKEVIINQQDFPICRLGRVTTRYITTQAETVGAVAWMNASPIGAYENSTNDELSNYWHIDLYQITEDADFLNLADVQLEISLLARF